MRRTLALTRLYPVALTLLVFAATAAAQLSISPSSIQFTVQNGSPSPQQNITINAPSPTSFTVNTSNTPWIDVVNQTNAKPPQGALITPATLVVSVANPIPTANQSGSLIFNVVGSINPGTAVPVTVTRSPPLVPAVCVSSRPG